jgi:hypothetical protein
MSVKKVMVVDDVVMTRGFYRELLLAEEVSAADDSDNKEDVS